MTEPITYQDAWSRAMSDFQIRETEIASRKHRFHVTTPTERKARRKRLIEAALIVVGLGAFAAICYGLSSPVPGAVPNHLAAPGVINADNAPVRWQRKDFDPSPRSVSGATSKTRRGASQPASGSVSKRKVKP